jgi:hypothetical protein
VDDGNLPDFSPRGSNTHQPANVSATSGMPGTSLSATAGGQSLAHFQHTHQVTVSFAAADRRPPYREVIIAQLDVNGCPD